MSSSNCKRPTASHSSSSFTPKRSRTDPKVVAQKSLFADRKLTSGTRSGLNHVLGSPVVERSEARNSRGGFVKSFTKSLYISKLKPSVTGQSVIAYLKENVPDIADDLFTLRLLVKKDQKLDELNLFPFV